MCELLWHAPPCWLSLSADLLICLHSTASVIISSNLTAASFRRVICPPNSKTILLLTGVMGKLHSGIAKISDNG